VVESPNGDEVKDTEKRYADVAEKYLDQYLHQPSVTRKTEQTDNYHVLSDYLEKAHQLSLEVAIKIGVPKPFWPVKKYGVLRVLEYNDKATTAPHKDFDLFTLMFYRNLPEYFKYIDQLNNNTKYEDFEKMKISKKLLRSAQELNAQVHFGEILEEIDSKAFLATPHEVVSSGGPWQYSVVYFAVPDEQNAVLPSGLSVGEWMAKRKGASRYAR
jgi:hypothetical protein